MIDKNGDLSNHRQLLLTKLISARLDSLWGVYLTENLKKFFKRKNLTKKDKKEKIFIILKLLLFFIFILFIITIYAIYFAKIISNDHFFIRHPTNWSSATDQSDLHYNKENDNSSTVK